MKSTTAQQFGSLGKSFGAPAAAAAVIGAALLASDTSDTSETAWSPAAACLLPDVLPVAGTLLSYGGSRQLAAGGTVTHSGAFSLGGAATINTTVSYIPLTVGITGQTSLRLGYYSPADPFIYAQSGGNMYLGSRSRYILSLNADAGGGANPVVGLSNDTKLGWSSTTFSDGTKDAYFVRNAASSIGLKGASGIDAAVTCGAITASGFSTVAQTGASGTSIAASGQVTTTFNTALVTTAHQWVGSNGTTYVTLGGGGVYCQGSWVGIDVVGGTTGRVNVGAGQMHITHDSGNRSLIKTYGNLELSPGALGGGGTYVEINNGTAGTYRDLLCRAITASGQVTSPLITTTTSYLAIADRSYPGWAYEGIFLRRSLVDVRAGASSVVGWTANDDSYNNAFDLVVGRDSSNTLGIYTSAARSTKAALTCGAITASDVVTSVNGFASGLNSGLYFPGGESVIRDSSGVNRLMVSGSAVWNLVNAVGSTMAYGIGDNYYTAVVKLARSGTTWVSQSDGGMQIKNFAGSADANLTCGAIIASGTIQETPTQSALDPTTTNIPSGKRQGWYNSTLSEFRDWVNIGGTLLKSAAYT